MRHYRVHTRATLTPSACTCVFAKRRNQVETNFANLTLCGAQCAPFAYADAPLSLYCDGNDHSYAQHPCHPWSVTHANDIGKVQSALRAATTACSVSTATFA